MKICSTCEHWDGGEASIGQCRRCPPKIVGQLLAKWEYPNAHSICHATRFPRTSLNQYCGEYKSKEHWKRINQILNQLGIKP